MDLDREFRSIIQRDVHHATIIDRPSCARVAHLRTVWRQVSHADATGEEQEYLILAVEVRIRSIHKVIGVGGLDDPLVERNLKSSPIADLQR